MRRSVLIALVVSVFMVAPAFAATIGPVKSNLSAGDFNYGLGYSNAESKWQEDHESFSDLEIQQNSFFAQFGYAFSNAWSGYLRAGIANQDAENVFLLSHTNDADLKADFEGTDPLPFVTVGANGLFFENDVLSIGGFIQGSYYIGENEDSVKYTGLIDSVTGAETVIETVTIDQMVNLKAGIQFQKELEGAQLYGGPMFYFSEADVESFSVGAATGATTPFSEKVEEEDNFGVVVGIQWQLLEDVSLDLEAQLRSGYDVGFVLNKKF